MKNANDFTQAFFIKLKKPKGADLIKKSEFGTKLEASKN